MTSIVNAVENVIVAVQYFDSFMWQDNNPTTLYWFLSTIIISISMYLLLSAGQWFASFFPLVPADQQQLQQQQHRLSQNFLLINFLNHAVTGVVSAVGVALQRKYSFLYFSLDEWIDTPIRAFVELLLWTYVHFAIYDFIFYWFHRWSHANKWMYRNWHAIHHEVRYALICVCGVMRFCKLQYFCATCIIPSLYL